MDIFKNFKKLLYTKLVEFIIFGKLWFGILVNIWTESNLNVRYTSDSISKSDSILQ